MEFEENLNLNNLNSSDQDEELAVQESNAHFTTSFERLRAQREQGKTSLKWIC